MTKQTTTTTATNVATFETLLRNFENSYRNKEHDPQTYSNDLQTLATACVYSVLKKLATVGGALQPNDTIEKASTKGTDSTATIRKIRQGLTSDLANINRLAYASENCTAFAYNDNGDLTTIVTDADLQKDFDRLASETLTDGIDLVNTAIETILDQTSKHASCGHFMDTPYSVTRLKKKVYIQKTDSVDGYETKQTTPIQEVYKSIRRLIESNRKSQVASHCYSYIQDSAYSDATGKTTDIYYRLPKYSGLAYETTDIYGKPTGTATADIASLEKVTDIVSKLNLTDRQAQVLSLRLSGYGYKAIATYLGMHHPNVVRTCQQIQKKAITIGLSVK